jgi:hypothetical protein
MSFRCVAILAVALLALGGCGKGGKSSGGAAAVGGGGGGGGGTGGSVSSVGVVSRINVTSGRIEDVSSLEAWKASFITPGMTDAQKALAIWKTVVKFRHQMTPPNEFLQSEVHPHDAIRCFAVYGYGQCCCASASIEALARYVGLQARGWGIIGHSVPEVYYDGAWHMMDASLVTYFPKADGTIAGVEEIIAGVEAWYAANPSYRGNETALRQFMQNYGWKNGPAVLSRSPFYDQNGWLPAGTHGWYSTMMEYADRSQAFVYEYGYSQGYQVNVQLRKGERLTRNWSHRGLHVNQLEGQAPWTQQDMVPGQGDMVYSPNYGDIAPGRVGNGTLEYDVPLADGSFRSGALSVDNLVPSSEDPGGATVHVQDGSRPGTLVLRMPSSYIYLSGSLNLTAAIGASGSIKVDVSGNNGLDWTTVATVTASGPRTIDLTSRVYRRYDYRLRLTLAGAGTGLNALRIAHDIQHSQRALPALAQGANAIRFSAGPQEGTVTVEGSLDPSRAAKNLVYTDFRPDVVGLSSPPLIPTGSTGRITFAVRTPGDMTRLRFGCHYRARDVADGWDFKVSYDNGVTFTKVGRAAGPTPGSSAYVSTNAPAGKRDALVRFEAQQVNTACIFDFRIDADYAEPSGGFSPVKITYLWDESGAAKQDVHVAQSASEQYTINCPGKPTLKSIVLERTE